MGALKILRYPVVWGLVLVAGGGALLADELFGLQLGGYFWGTIALLGGLIFLAEFIGRGRQAWWALIPGISLLGLGATILVDALSPSLGAGLGGLFFLGSIGLGFFLVYLADRNHWWAIIPAGVLSTLAVVSIPMTSMYRQVDRGSFFFVGLGLTFVLVALLPTPQGKMTWAYIPGGILLVFGLLLLIAHAEMLAFVVPAALIVIGLGLVVRSFWK